MIVSLKDFEIDVPKYMYLALRNPILVVDTQKGRSWIIKRGNDSLPGFHLKDSFSSTHQRHNAA